MSTSKGHNVGESTFLKTTTWGALIALPLVAVAWGVSSYSPLAHDDGDADQVAYTRPAEDSSTNRTQAAPQRESFLAEALSRAAKLNPFSRSKTAANKNGVLSAQAQLPVRGTLNGGNGLKPVSQLEDANQNMGFGGQGSDEAKAAAVARKISPDLKSVKANASGDVIVQFHQPPTDADLMGQGATKKAELPLVKAELVNVKGANLSSLASQANVAYISPNRPVRGTLDHVVTAVNADIAYSNGWNGTGVGVAVIDSGVGSVDDLNSDGNAQPSRVVYSQSFLDSDPSPVDGYGHGTHVSGIIAGNGYDASMSGYPGVYRGIAPEAQIINFRVLDSTGSGNDSSVIAAIQQAIALQTTYNIRVLNISLGRQVFESYTMDPLCQAVEAAWNAGIVVVVAAGNMGESNDAGTNGYGTVGAPGNDPYVITVGATNTHDTGLQTSQTMTSYSSKGPTAIDNIVKPDLVAPGNHVVSLLAANATLSTNYPQDNVYPCDSTLIMCGSQYGPAQYLKLSGTSMATPVVSGVAALVLQQNPSMTPDQVKARLMKTAWKGFPSTTTATDLGSGVVYTTEEDIFSVGAGAVDASAALASTDLAPANFGSAKSPSVTYD